jgi:hypothetical protein
LCHRLLNEGVAMDASINVTSCIWRCESFVRNDQLNKAGDVLAGEP